MLCKSTFVKRQETSSRQYYTLSGVTIHKQLEVEHGRSPRRHKLAEKIPKAQPCSRLTPGKWYTHVHQVKLKTRVNGLTEWSKLRSIRLIKTLRRTFGENYHPRSNDYQRNLRNGVSINHNRRRNPNTHSRRNINSNEANTMKHGKSWQQLQNAFEDCPMPMAAPRPATKLMIKNNPSHIRDRVRRNGNRNN